MKKVYVAIVEDRIVRRVFIESDSVLDAASELEDCSNEFIERFEPELVTRELLGLRVATDEEIK